MAQTAVIAGVGPGLGESIVRKFCDEGWSVGMFARTEDYLERLAEDLQGSDGDALPVPTDITKPEEVERGFERVRDEFGPVDTLVNHASAASWEGLFNLTPKEFEKSWKVTAYGAFLCSQEAVNDMLANDGGTVIFTGATSSTRGADGALAFSSAKFGARGMAQSMAQELGPEGIQVCHVVIDGQIDSPRLREIYPDRSKETFLDPDEMAETYWHLVEQNVSTMVHEVHITNGTQNIEFI